MELIMTFILEHQFEFGIFALFIMIVMLAENIIELRRINKDIENIRKSGGEITDKTNI